MTTKATPYDLWVEEDMQGIVRTRYRVTKTLFDATSDFQHIAIVQTAAQGCMLINDGDIKIS